MKDGYYWYYSGADEFSVHDEGGKVVEIIGGQLWFIGCDYPQDPVNFTGVFDGPFVSPAKQIPTFKK
jgi:hypothetical protein